VQRDAGAGRLEADQHRRRALRVWNCATGFCRSTVMPVIS